MTKVISVDKVEPVEMLPGIYRRTLSYSDKAMIVHFTIEQGAAVPVHDHPHDQITFVVEGELEFTVAGEKFTLRAGDSILSPGGVGHGAKAVQRTIVTDTFAPPREDYK
jgi:quercetin dioxygenase-like cupin family protein